MASHPSCDRWCLAMHEQGRADHEQQTRRDELDEMPRCTCLKDRVPGQLRVSGPRTSRASSWMRQKFPLFLHLATSSCRVFCSSSGVLLKSAGGTFDSRQRRFDESNPQFSSMVKPCKKNSRRGYITWLNSLNLKTPQLRHRKKKQQNTLHLPPLNPTLPPGTSIRNPQTPTPPGDQLIVIGGALPRHRRTRTLAAGRSGTPEIYIPGVSKYPGKWVQVSVFMGSCPIF